MQNLRNMSKSDMRVWLKSHGGSDVHAARLFEALYEPQPFRWEQLEIKKNLVEKIRHEGVVSTFRSWQIFPSEDGSSKLLCQVGENESIESVRIVHESRVTCCVSSQVGCAMGCGFCLTGQMGLKRSLKAWEIVEQVRLMSEIYAEQAITNVVFMGMGEPFHNFVEVQKAVDILSDDSGLAIPRRKITVSTVGLPDKIREWSRVGQTNLAVSITGSDDETRSRWMPINQRFPLDELTQALVDYIKASRQKVLVQYVLIKNETDRPEDVQRLTARFRSLPITLNLIPFNPHPGCKSERPEKKDIERFRDALKEEGIFATIRWSHAGDVLGACGQLATHPAADHLAQAQFNGTMI